MGAFNRYALCLWPLWQLRLIVSLGLQQAANDAVTNTPFVCLFAPGYLVDGVGCQLFTNHCNLAFAAAIAKSKVMEPSACAFGPNNLAVYGYT